MFHGLICVQTSNAVQNHHISGEINTETSWRPAKCQVPEFTFGYSAPECIYEGTLSDQ